MKRRTQLDTYEATAKLEIPLPDYLTCQPIICLRDWSSGSPEVGKVAGQLLNTMSGGIYALRGWLHFPFVFLFSVSVVKHAKGRAELLNFQGGCNCFMLC